MGNDPLEAECRVLSTRDGGSARVPASEHAGRDLASSVISALLRYRHTRVIMTDAVARLSDQSVLNHPWINLRLPKRVDRLAVGSDVPQVGDLRRFAFNNLHVHWGLRFERDTILDRFVLLSLIGLAVRLIRIAVRRALSRLLQTPGCGGGAKERAARGGGRGW